MVRSTTGATTTIPGLNYNQHRNNSVDSDTTNITEHQETTMVYGGYGGNHDGRDEPGNNDEDNNNHTSSSLSHNIMKDILLLGSDAASSINHDHDASSPAKPELTGVRLIATLVKSFIGSGVLFLPKAFSNGGWLFSIIAMIFMAFLSGLCILRLIACRQITSGTYGEVGRKAVGKWGEIAVDISLVLSQAGFGCVYVVFIARNVLQLLNSDSCWLDGSYLWLLILFEWPIFTPLTWVRNIAKFGPTNVLADVLIAGGLIGILGYSFYGMGQVDDHSTISIPVFNSNTFSLMLGTSVYAFEGVGMVVPIYDALSPIQQRKFPVTMSITLAGIALVYITVGMVPYIYLAGMANIPIQDAVTLNLPRVWWSYLITAGYCLALLFSYPLMLFPAVKILEKWVSPYLFTYRTPGRHGTNDGSEDEEILMNKNKKLQYHFDDDDVYVDNTTDEPDEEGNDTPKQQQILHKGYFRWRRNIYRAGIVAVTLLIAYVGSEQLDNFVSLIGAFCCAPLAFVYPCLFHYILVPNTSKFSKLVDISIMIFGMGVLAFSTYEAIAGWSISPINPCLRNNN